MNNINQLAVYEYGSKENPAVIFIHGFPFDASMWEPQINALKENYYCVAYDVRGFGASHHGDGQFTIEAFADDVFAVLDGLGISKAVICGLSMGGYIALRAFEKHPERFSGIILCDTKPEADDNAGKIKRAASPQRISEIGSEEFVRGFIPVCVYEPNIAKLGSALSSLTDKYIKVNILSLKGAQIAMAGRTDTTHILSGIKTPALIVGGEYDTFAPPEVMKAMADKISGADYFLVPDAGHLAPLEQSGAVNNRIIKFLSGIHG